MTALNMKAGPATTGRSLRPDHSTRMRARGYTLVELLVGMTAGLCVLAGAGTLAVGHASHARRLALATQLQQDMRAALDIVVRDLRRSGHDGSAHRLLRVVPDSAPAPSPAVYLPARAAGADAIDLTSSHDRDRGDAENGHVDSDEAGGFRLDPKSGALQVRLGAGGYQDLTDRQVMTVTAFSVRQVDHPIALACVAAAGCAAPAGCTQTVRLLQVELRAQSRSDTTVQRALQSAVRVRNDPLKCAP